MFQIVFYTDVRQKIRTFEHPFLWYLFLIEKNTPANAKLIYLLFIYLLFLLIIYSVFFTFFTSAKP
jgi:hypothetical protein